MSELHYDDIQAIWEKEVENVELQDLQDMRLGKIVAYLSQIRLALAHTDAKDRLKSDLLQKETQNLEFMLKDLLMLFVPQNNSNNFIEILIYKSKLPSFPQSLQINCSHSEYSVCLICPSTL